MAYGYGLGLGAPFVGNYGVSSPTGNRTAPRTNQGRGSSKNHGTDYRTPAGTQAIASQDGIVTRVAYDPKGYGHYVAIYNPETGVATQWAHMGSIDVKPGQRVKRGQPIGKTGNSGNSSGAHLDYTVTRNGVSIRQDGSEFLPTGKAWLTGKTVPATPANPVAPTQPALAATPAPSVPTAYAAPAASGLSLLSAVQPLNAAEQAAVADTGLSAYAAAPPPVADFFQPARYRYG